MSNVLQFIRRPHSTKPLLSRGAPFDISVRVTDDFDPDTTHWELLRWNFRAARFGANRRFKQAVARSGRWHHFQIGTVALARRYLRETYRLRNAGLIQLRIDGIRVPATVGRPAAAA